MSFCFPMWQGFALQPAATVVVMEASPLALRTLAVADDQVSGGAVLLGATYQKLPFEALHAE